MSRTVPFAAQVSSTTELGRARAAGALAKKINPKPPKTSEKMMAEIKLLGNFLNWNIFHMHF
jgi:hypothetical protein